MSSAPSAVSFWRWGDSVDILQRCLETGGVLAIPTESSYGLAVDPRHDRGVEAVLRIKGARQRKPLGVVVSAVEQVLMLGVKADDPGLCFGARYWPAPLSVLVDVALPCPAMLGAKKLAVRVPSHQQLRTLLHQLGHPLTATSANRSTESPILSPEGFVGWLAGERLTVVDDGTLPGGEPSTVVNWQARSGGSGEPRVLREGRFKVPGA